MRDNGPAPYADAGVALTALLIRPNDGRKAFPTQHRQSLAARSFPSGVCLQQAVLYIRLHTRDDRWNTLGLTSLRSMVGRSALDKF